MGSFLSNIMSKLGGGRGSRAPFINLGAFGKHPGWDDHIDDLGLESPQLINAKRIFYVQGMSGNIDSGAWDHLSEEDQLKHFRHVFAWRVGDDLIVGRLWSSSDGKGRKRYPMIVPAWVTRVPRARRATPRSASFTMVRSAARASRMFSGLRSRWTIPCVCA